MSFSAESYHEAAKDRLTDAYLLYRHGHHVLSLYSSGLAVECMLRAYRTRFDPVFDSRHDLLELYRSSKLQQWLGEEQEEKVVAALSKLTRWWRNSHRYESISGLRRFIKRGRHDRGLRGDALKEIARAAHNAGEIVVSVGVARWIS